MLDMAVEIGIRNDSREVRRIGQRRNFVAEVSAGHHRPGRGGQRHVQTGGHAHQRHAHGAGRPHEVPVHTEITLVMKNAAIRMYCGLISFSPQYTM